MTLHVHVLNPLATEEQATLESAMDPGVALTLGPDLPQPAHYEILVAGRPEREHLLASPALRALIVPFAGVPDGTRDLLREFPHIAVHNLHHNAAATAEMAVALLLAAAKRLVPADRGLRAHDWTLRHGALPSLLLWGKTALILGFGQIGQHVARACQGLGMQVLAVRRRPEQPLPHDLHAEVYAPEALERLLPRTHALIVTLPLTAETRGLIGARELALMPPGGLVVNVGRGPVIDQGALYEALRAGHLHGAGLDVWYRYPESADARAHTPPADYPFHELDEVVMSPHRGGDALEIETWRMRHLADLLNAAAHGQPIPNRVDLAAGY